MIVEIVVITLGAMAVGGLLRLVDRLLDPHPASKDDDTRGGIC